MVVAGIVYPKRAETTITPYALVDANAVASDLSFPRFEAFGTGLTACGNRLSRKPPEVGATLSADTEDHISGRSAGERVCAFLTESISQTGDRFRRERMDPRLALVNPASPYRFSGTAGNDVRLVYVTARIERSLFDAGQAAGLSESLIFKLAEIFGWDIDFALDLRAGDSFSVVLEQKYWFGRKIGDGTILAAEFINQGDVYRAIGFRDDSGRLGYYTPNGRNMRRTFLRTPVRFSRISSGFQLSRYHPILKLWCAHTGVDYAAPAGTPVRATAAGTVVARGWNGGYGRAVELDHGGGYSTLYAHLSGYRDDLHVGTRVEQGETIGYVGSSGLATGPHLHYEFRVDGRYKNPLTYDFPNGKSVAPDKRDTFRNMARAWIDELDHMARQYVASR